MRKEIMNFLAMAFFVLASIWLLFAVLYAMAVCLFLRMRARGQLRQNITDPEYGRVYLCNSTTAYIPMGWVFRRFVMYHRNEQERARMAKARVMTTQERRAAVECLLEERRPKEERGEDGGKDVEAASAALETNSTTSEGPVCAICLLDYSDSKPFHSEVCSHTFHRECLVEWFSKPCSRDCPVCRTEMIQEEHVWMVVRQHRKSRTQNQRASRAFRIRTTPDDEDEGNKQEIQLSPTFDSVESDS